jgi:DNA-binding response OmpR family regulator
MNKLLSKGDQDKQPLQPRILCIDDDLDTCLMLTIALGMSNYEVESANTCADGLSKSLAGGYQFILLDAQLPDGSGREICQQIRQTDHHIPICFYSADAFPAQIEEAMEAGANVYFVKPTSPFEVEQTITRLLQ